MMILKMMKKILIFWFHEMMKNVWILIVFYHQEHLSLRKWLEKQISSWLFSWNLETVRGVFGWWEIEKK